MKPFHEVWCDFLAKEERGPLPIGNGHSSRIRFAVKHRPGRYYFTNFYRQKEYEYRVARRLGQFAGYRMMTGRPATIIFHHFRRDLDEYGDPWDDGNWHPMQTKAIEREMESGVASAYWQGYRQGEATPNIPEIHTDFVVNDRGVGFAFWRDNTEGAARKLVQQYWNAAYYE